MTEESVVVLSEDSKLFIERKCIICSSEIILRGCHDITMVCKDCCKMMYELKQTRKSNWIADSKGGEPNCRRG